MKQFIAIIGGRDAGKSTVISSLTGCPTRTFRGFVRDLAVGESIYVVASSPQENPLSRTKLKNILKQVRSARNCRGIVIALQPSHPYRRLSMEDIFYTVQANKAFTIHAFVLDPEYNGTRGSLKIVRKRLKPLSIQVKSFNAMRFAFATSTDINRIVNVI